MYCAGFVDVQDGRVNVVQYDPTAFVNPTFGLWDFGGDAIIHTLMHHSTHTPHTVFRVMKHDGMSEDAMEAFKVLEHPPNVVYFTPSVHDAVTLPDNIRVLYSPWNVYYSPSHEPELPDVPHTVQKVCFRGQASSDARVRMCDDYRDHPLCDFEITKGTWHPEFASDPHVLSHDRQRRYRALVAADGGGFPGNLAWIMGSGCVPVLHAKFKTGLQMDMKPWVHYVPLSDTNVRWIFDNPAEADEIIRNAKRLYSGIRQKVREQFSRVQV